MTKKRLKALIGVLLVLGMLTVSCSPTTPPPESEPPPVIPSPAPTPIPTPAPTPSPAPTPATGEFEQTFKCHFGFMPASWDFKGAHQAGGGYDRPFFELFQWGMIEVEPGIFHFNKIDRYILMAQEEGFHILANIQPFAHWDQIKCHQDLPKVSTPGPNLQLTKGSPCDMKQYQKFVTKLVERYDGDGVDDMPGLLIPIKHWEVLNEPEFQREPLVFFQGSPQDYFETLKATYESVKKADPEALIVQGGMAGMMPECADFWQSVFDLGGAFYFDIANMHSIGHGEHLNIPAFKEFLLKNGIQDKPIWVTEVQYQQAHQTENYSSEEFAKIMARSYIFALANSVEKLFYVNIRMPQIRHGVPFDERSALIKDNGDKSPLFYAHLTIANLLGELSQGDKVEKIKEEVADWHIDQGQYKFNIKGRIIYALWGADPLPSEISGEVKVIEISGEEKIIDAATLKLSDSPVFIVIDNP